MENEATGGVKGKFSMGGCGVIGGECSVMGIHDCEEQFDRYGTKADGSENPIGKVSYWIFQAVKGMQNKFTILRNKLVDETIVTNLLIGEMVEAFQGNEDQTEEVFKWLSAAIGLGSTVGGLIPGAVSFSPIHYFVLRRYHEQTLTSTGRGYLYRPRHHGWYFRYHCRGDKARGNQPGHYLIRPCRHLLRNLQAN